MRKSAKNILKISGGAAVILLLAFFMVPPYIITALVYQKPDIDDYKVFSNRVVRAEEPQPWKLAPTYNQKSFDDELRNKIEGLQTVSFLVIQDTMIKYEAYWDGYGKGKISNSFSVAKSIISILAGIALDEGKIKSPDQKVRDFIPKFQGGKKNKLTIRHLLTMSSGLEWDEEYSTLFSKTTRAYYGNNLQSLIGNLDVVEEPGKLFEYQSCNVQLLMFILEKATGMKLSDYASEKLWKPIGAEHDALWSLDRKGGNEKAYCCFNACARDFARLGQLVLNHGTWNGKQIISQEYLAEATSPQPGLKDRYGRDVTWYGYQWWIVNYNGHPVPYARGILGQYIFVIPWKNAVVVRLGHERSSHYRDNAPIDVYTYLEAAMQILD